MSATPSSGTVRRDAARNHDRIVAAAQAAMAADRPLQFNEIARSAEVGVGTVYRHFSSPEALREAAVLERLRDLLLGTERSDATAEPWEALSDFIRSAVLAQQSDAALTEVIAQPTDSLEETAQVRSALATVFEQRVAAAAGAGVLRGDVSAADITALLCGTAYAARAGGPDRVGLYLDVLLAGLRSDG